MDPIIHLRDLAPPQPTDLLEMEVEELVGILLAAIQRSGPRLTTLATGSVFLDCSAFSNRAARRNRRWI